MLKMAKNRDFGHVEGDIMPRTPLNYLCFLAYLFFGFTNHIWFTVADKIQGFRLLKGLKCPKTAIFGAPTTQKTVFTPLNLVRF